MTKQLSTHTDTLPGAAASHRSRLPPRRWKPGVSLSLRQEGERTNGLAAALLKGPVASGRLCLSVHLVMPVRQAPFLFFRSVPEMLPNLEPEASSLRRRVLTLEEDESGACWPCIDPGGREVMGWDEMLAS